VESAQLSQLSSVTASAHDANQFPSKNQQGVAMNIHLSLGPLVALIAGILILIVPRLLNFIVAIYLIIIGLIGVFGLSGTHF
jgi:Protein of unknown function (DUF3096)